MTSSGEPAPSETGQPGRADGNQRDARRFGNGSEKKGMSLPIQTSPTDDLATLVDRGCGLQGPTKARINECVQIGHSSAGVEKRMIDSGRCLCGAYYLTGAIDSVSPTGRTAERAKV